VALVKTPAVAAAGAIAASFIILLALPGAASAQWVHYPSPGIPRTADGKPNLSAPAPRAPDGKPDLSGIWSPDVKYLNNIAADLKPEEVPFQPWAAAVFKQRQENSMKDDPGARCMPPGLPRRDATPFPFKIIVNPGLVLILYETRNVYRQIFTDGRSFPKEILIPSWDGYSIGRWDGDTLVIDTIGFNDQSWMDNAGHPHSDAMHLTERFHRRDFGHMDLQITIDDPKAYTKPWTITEHPRLLPDMELMEQVCEENNKDVEHLVGK